MDTPRFIFARLEGLVRGGTDTAHRRRVAQFPRGDETPEQIAAAVAWAEEQVHSEFRKIEELERIELHRPAKERERLEGIIGRDRLNIQRNRAKAAQNLRNSWVEAKHRIHQAAAE